MRSRRTARSCLARLTPNLSLKRSANGSPPGRLGRTLGVILNQPRIMLACSLYLLTALVIVTPVVAEAACNIVNGKAFGDCQNVAVRQGIGAVLNVRSHVTESGIVADATVPPGGNQR